MGMNNIQYAALFQKMLDKIAAHECKTAYMEGNAGQVIYNGGNTVKIPKMSLNGLGNYDRDTGYVQGSVTFAYEDRTMTQDRGRMFQIDAMDVDETNFTLTANTMMSEFQRVSVNPEIDAYRISKLAQVAIAAGNVTYGYTPGSQATLAQIKEAIKKIRENGFESELICHINYDALTDIELQAFGKISDVTFSQNGLDTRVKSIDDVVLIPMPKTRMYTAITVYDGTTSGQTAGGYVKASTGKDINFIVLDKNAPIAVSKQDKMRIFSPDENQTANAWKMDYRRYHDIWVKDNMAGSIYVNIKDTANP